MPAPVHARMAFLISARESSKSDWPVNPQFVRRRPDALVFGL